MKIRLYGLIATGIYICIMLSAFFNMRYQLSEGRTWSRLFLMSIMLVIMLDLIYVFLEILDRKGRIGLSIAVALLFIAYELIISYFNELIVVPEILRDVVPWPLTFAVLYHHITEHGIPERFRIITMAGLSVCCVLSVPNVARHLVDYGRSGAVIFPVYYCIGFLGVYLRLASGKSRYVFMTIVALILIVSTKRLGVLAVMAGIVVWFYGNAFIQGTLKDKSRKYVLYTFLLIVAMAVFFILIERFNVSTIERFLNLAEDEGSGRGYIWRVVMEHFGASSLLHKVFGHGYHSVAYRVYIWDRAQSMAHNSYMETMYDYGLLGLLFVLLFVAFIVKKTVAAGKRHTESFPALAYSMAGLALFSLFSYFFEQSVIILPYIVLWSICLGEEQYRERIREGEA